MTEQLETETRPIDRKAIKPVVLRAPKVLEHLQSSKAALAALEFEIAERALTAAEGTPGGKAKLSALHEQIRTVTFEIDCNAKAHALALEKDREAIAARRAAILALPAEKLIAGVSATACPKLCEMDMCVISGTNRCLHPRDSNIPAAMTSDLRLRKVYHLASEKLRTERQNERNKQ